MKCQLCTRRAFVSGLCNVHTPVRCKCGLVANRRYCAQCTPEPSLKKKYEMEVKQFLDAEGLDDYVHNKAVCKLLKPDFLFHRPHAVMIVEVDEFGHKHYDKGNEERRMCAISGALKKQTRFIRLRMPCEKPALNTVAALLRGEQAEHNDVDVIDYYNGERVCM